MLGDAYEYLMRHFATESGKSKGQFYTPAEVSRILAQVVGITAETPRKAVILPHGVLFRGNAEVRIREKLVCQGYIKGIIGLPANLFYGTGIPACIIVIDKADMHQREGIFMVIPNADLDAIDSYWRVFPNLRRTLFAPSQSEGY